MSKKVLIAGANGFIGRNLTRLLQGSGYQVKWLVREKPVEKPAKLAVNSVEKITWNHLLNEGLDEKFTAVINLAGAKFLVPFKAWTPKFQSEIRDSRVKRTSQLRDAILNCSHPPEVFLCASGVSGYAPDASKVYTEQDPFVGYDFLSQLAVDWEETSKMPADFNKTRTVQLRLGVVLGREDGLVGEAFWQYFFGFGGYMGSGNQWLPWIHKKDVCEAIRFIMESAAISGPVNLTSPNVATHKEFSQTFAAAMGRWSCLWYPEFLLGFHWFPVNRMFHPDASVTILKGQNVFPKKLIDSGFEFQLGRMEGACKECAHFSFNDEEKLAAQL